MASDPLLDTGMTPDHDQFWEHLEETAEEFSTSIIQGNTERTDRKGRALLHALLQVYATPEMKHHLEKCPACDHNWCEHGWCEAQCGAESPHQSGEEEDHHG